MSMCMYVREPTHTHVHTHSNNPLNHSFARDPSAHRARMSRTIATVSRSAGISSVYLQTYTHIQSQPGTNKCALVWRRESFLEFST